MNAKFEWFGFSVARKHVYFYTMLLLATFAGNMMKDRLTGGSSEDQAAFAELNHITEQVASLQADLPQP